MANTQKKKNPSSKANAGGKRVSNTQIPSPFRRELAGAVSFFLGLFSLFGCFQTEAVFIQAFSNLLRGVVGVGFWLYIPAFLAASYILMCHRGLPILHRVLCAYLIPLFYSCLSYGFIRKDNRPDLSDIGAMWEMGKTLEGCGVLGSLLGGASTLLFTGVGTIVVFSVLTILMALGTVNLSVMDIIDWYTSRPRYQPPEPTTEPPKTLFKKKKSLDTVLEETLPPPIRRRVKREKEPPMTEETLAEEYLSDELAQLEEVPVVDLPPLPVIQREKSKMDIPLPFDVLSHKEPEDEPVPPLKFPNKIQTREGKAVPDPADVRVETAQSMENDVFSAWDSLKVPPSVHQAPTAFPPTRSMLPDADPQVVEQLKASSLGFFNKNKTVPTPDSLLKPDPSLQVDDTETITMEQQPPQEAETPLVQLPMADLPLDMTQAIDRSVFLSQGDLPPVAKPYDGTVPSVVSTKEEGNFSRQHGYIPPIHSDLSYTQAIKPLTSVDPFPPVAKAYIPPKTPPTVAMPYVPEESIFETPITNTGYDTPISDSGYDTPISDCGYDTPITNTGYDMPISDTGYDMPISDSGYDTPISDTGYDTPISDSGYDTPISDTGYDMPISDSGYDTPISDCGYNTPISDSGYDMPISDSGFDIPPTAPVMQKPLSSFDIQIADDPSMRTLPPQVNTMQIPDVVPMQSGFVMPTYQDDTPDPAVVAMEKEMSSQPQGKAYKYPPVSLLKPGSICDTSALEEELQQNREQLESTLKSFGIETTVEEMTQGPSVTSYEVKLPQGVKLSKIVGLSDDIALSLGSGDKGVRIAPVANKASMVGIEVPNRVVSPVEISTVVGSANFINSKSKVSFAIGKDITGDAIIGDISSMPHLMIAGTTGSGKSVCTNALIISLLYKATPEEVRLIMIDPKMVELGAYNGIPHLLIPVITDSKKAAGALQWSVHEMERRYRTFLDVGVRELESYNQKARASDDLEPMPKMVIIIDELADLMMVAAKDVEESIIRVAQKGRAAGIHLIVATQRPSADVITGLMKSNIPSRIAFAVASNQDSRIILDTVGAEKLVGRGDMLYSPVGGQKASRIQGCYITDPEVAAVVQFVKEESGIASYSDEVMEQIDQNVAAKEKSTHKNANTQASFDDDGQDDMMDAAIELVLDSKVASTSNVQRRLKIGYNRAARIMDQMEDLGIVGLAENGKGRALLITKDQWREIQYRRSGGSSQPAHDEEEEEIESPPW